MNILRSRTSYPRFIHPTGVGVNGAANPVAEIRFIHPGRGGRYVWYCGFKTVPVHPPYRGGSLATVVANNATTVHPPYRGGRLKKHVKNQQVTSLENSTNYFLKNGRFSLAFTDKHQSTTESFSWAEPIRQMFPENVRIRHL